jgi:hypothetical protein
MKKIAVLLVIAVVFMSGTAYAGGADLTVEGQTILVDMMYGAAIGAVLGAAVYAFDQERFGNKVLTGAALGTMGGFAIGVYSTVAPPRSVVAIDEEGDVRLSAPVIKVIPTEGGLAYHTDLLTYTFN